MLLPVVLPGAGYRQGDAVFQYARNPVLASKGLKTAAPTLSPFRNRPEPGLARVGEPRVTLPVTGPRHNDREERGRRSRQQRCTHFTIGRAVGTARVRQEDRPQKVSARDRVPQRLVDGEPDGDPNSGRRGAGQKPLHAEATRAADCPSLRRPMARIAAPGLLLVVVLVTGLACSSSAHPPGRKLQQSELMIRRGARISCLQCGGQPHPGVSRAVWIATWATRRAGAFRSAARQQGGSNCSQRGTQAQLQATRALPDSVPM